ncbi:hypothetical protein B9G55_14465 [Saccharibacillus sp. O16]|nr:hypothetical protein B9G55_14465 [Saccharibacillus sp. O16]
MNSRKNTQNPTGSSSTGKNNSESTPTNQTQRDIPLLPLVDLSAELEGWEVMTATLGYNGKAYLMLTGKTPPVSQTSDLLSAASSPSAPPPRQKVLIVNLAAAASSPAWDEVSIPIEEQLIEGESLTYHYAQPLGEELLVVSARSRYEAHDRYDLNAVVWGKDGSVQRRFLLGDGIQQVQTTAGGLIWTSYFDEGVFGNYGWKRPVGESGLIAWDREGIRVFTNSEANIADCYALNVCSDQEVWFYYYTDFLLGHLSGDAAQPEVSFADPQIRGSSVVVTDGQRFLLDKGYQQHEQYVLLQPDPSGRLIPRDSFVFSDGQKQIDSGLRDARGGTLLLLEDAKLYRVTLDELDVTR